MLELAFELSVVHHLVEYWMISTFWLFWAAFGGFFSLKTAKIEVQCGGSFLKYETKLKVFCGSEDYYNFWLHLEKSNVEDFGPP